MGKQYILFSILCVLTSCGVKAQGSFEEFKKKKESEYASYKDNKKKEFEEYRNKVNDEYAALIKKSWKEHNSIKGAPIPDKDKTVPPVVFPDEDKGKPIKDNPKPIEEVVPIVKPEPQPEPVVPIEDTPKPPIEIYYTFKFFNTNLQVRLENKHRFTLNGCNEKEIANVWNRLSGAGYNNVINDCLSIRSQKSLCDWAYLLMLQDLSDDFFRAHCNESVLFTAFLYCQSGYKMRLASANNKLYLLYASNHIIYNQSYWELEGQRFYPLDCNAKQLQICQAKFPNEKPLSLLIDNEQMFALHPSSKRTLRSERFRDVTAVVSTNENLIKFFDLYPTSMINEDFGTRWAMYANTPLSQQARSTLYPALRDAINGKSQFEAVSRLLNFVQTAFVYEYDEKVWGYDRAFFAEETLYYPYSDCEDRAILFSVLVRDLLGLKVVLIYYPGHLATAVYFTENVTGDYINLSGKRYIVCDPTFIGAPIGATMPTLNNTKTKVILLE